MKGERVLLNIYWDLMLEEDIWEVGRLVSYNYLRLHWKDVLRNLGVSLLRVAQFESPPFKHHLDYMWWSSKSNKLNLEFMRVEKTSLVQQLALFIPFFGSWSKNANTFSVNNTQTCHSLTQSSNRETPEHRSKSLYMTFHGFAGWLRMGSLYISLYWLI